MNRSKAFVLVAAVVVVAVAASGIDLGGTKEATIVVGKIDNSAPRVRVPKKKKTKRDRAGFDRPVFQGATNVPKDLKFFLVVGSDARPGNDPVRGLADSIHVVAVDPVAKTGTILGIPRDSYVNVPGHGFRKINSALPLGGPELLVRTVRELTGLPVSYYAVTAFDGIVAIVDALGGVDVNVPYAMSDPQSGAFFSSGRHHMNGRQVLAFTRARKTISGGDFARSENHGRVILHALEKFRAQAAGEAEIRRWLDVLFAHARLDMSIGDALALGHLARELAPAKLTNVVARGTGGGTVSLGEPAYALFRDVGADAEADGNEKRTAPPPTPTPAATPSPSPTPSPSRVPTLDR